jgi:hypothetical protein
VKRAVALAAVVALAAGCGVRSSKPYTAKGTAPCLAKHGFTGVTTKPMEVGFIAGFAENGGIRAASASGNVVTIAFTADSDSTASTVAAFKAHAPQALRSHMSDITQVNRNAVLVWTVTPKGDESDAAARCLAP